MKILILSWRGPGHPNEGGAEIVTHEHAKAWVRAHNKVTLFTSNFEKGKSEETIDGVRILRYGNQFITVQLYAFVWYIKHSKEFDLVIDQFHGLPFFTPLFVKVKKVAFIHEVAKNIWRLNNLPKPLNLIPAFVGPFIEPLIFRLYSKIKFMTVSKSTASDLVEWNIPSKNIHIIENGVHLSLPNKGLTKEKKNTAIFLGAVSRDKGVEDALRVFSELEKKGDKWNYWIVGKASKDYLNHLKKLAISLGLNKRIVFWGFVAEEKKFELLQKAHILINPSAREGWCLVNIEANAAGTPVVGYNVAGMRDSVIQGKTGILHDFGDYKALAESVHVLVNSPKQYNRFQNAARVWSANFNWRNTTNRSLRLLKSV